MTYSFAKRKESGDPKGKLILHVARRAVIIFGLGLFLAGFPFGLFGDSSFSLFTIRIPGVLQRIAVCYFIASIIFLYTTTRGQLYWIGGLLALYWLLMKLVPVPGYGPGVLDPIGNLCWWVDSNLLAGHTWRGAPVPGFDPEGIVSTIPAIATTLFGILIGTWLRTGLGPGTEVLPFSHIEDCETGRNCRIGPYARIRPGTRLAEDVHVGNFVEVKNSQIGDRSKANHLSYVGDATVGREVNNGAGSITCNYDGANKHRTVIEDDGFIGSDTALVAPVTVGRGATIGAGSTISRDAPAGQLTVSRAKQVSLPAWKRPVKKPKI